MADSLRSIDAGAILALLNAQQYAGIASLHVNGTLKLGGALCSVVALSGSGTLIGFGTVTSSIHDRSASHLAVQAVGGTLDLTGDNRLGGQLRGTGTLSLSEGSDIIVGSAVVTVATLALAGAEVTLGENMTFNRGFALSRGELDLRSHVLTLSGSAQFTGGSVVGSGILRLTAKSVVSSTGTTTINANLLNDAAIDVTGGSLDIGGRVTGTGSFGVGNSAELEFDGAVLSSQTIDFAHGTTGTLLLTDARAFEGTVAGLVAGDTIDLTDFAVSGATFSFSANGNHTGGTLSVASGANQATLTLDGRFIASGFHLHADAAGTGTAVTYTPPRREAMLAASHS